jgi:hypothetical protein
MILVGGYALLGSGMVMLGSGQLVWWHLPWVAVSVVGLVWWREKTGRKYSGIKVS